jgi:predicted Zn finger-like uncharacterized protein
MKVQCPSCKTLYNIDDAKIPDKGANVTCAKCKTRFEVRKTPNPQPAHSAAPKQDKIIICPSCQHINLTMDKCVQCGYAFTLADKDQQAIKI